MIGGGGTIAAAAALLLSGAAEAAEPVGYALLVGSNQPGPGQQPLQHAVTDAARMQAVLTELGGYADGHVVMLADPSAAALDGALDALEERLRAHADRDEDTVVVFYYSGHARASGLNLGAEEVPLAGLRERLEGLPATVRLVVLDACQSGALARAKGAAPAAEFSHSSVLSLQAEGTAVIASSSAGELSQESASLQGGFFTHHLVAGLRGAADGDGDGRVDLDEAYRYAYRGTLQSTAATAVGGQHPVMQSDLERTGDMILTRPAQARARLALPADLSAELLLTHAESGAVLAEVHKAAGAPMQIALPAGRYATILRAEGQPPRSCPLTLAEDQLTAWDGRGCRRLAPGAVAVRGDGSAAAYSRERRELLHLELSGGYMPAEVATPYTARLEDFSYDGTPSPLSYTISAAWSLRGPLSLVVGGGMMEDARYARTFNLDGEEDRDTFCWRTWRLGVSPRASYALGRSGWLVPYAQAGVGVAMATSAFQLHDEEEVTIERQWGPMVSVAAGVQAMGPRRHLGLFAQGEYATAPVLDNLVGDRHVSGGPILSVGLRAGL